MVIARVVRAAMCKAEDIIDHCARNLAPYKFRGKSSSANSCLGAGGAPSAGARGRGSRAVLKQSSARARSRPP